MARRLKEVLGRKVLRRVRKTARELEAMEEVWRRVVPGRYAAVTRVAGWKRRELTVAVEGSPALAELSGFFGEALLRELNALLAASGRPTARSVRFVLEEELGEGT